MLKELFKLLKIEVYYDILKRLASFPRRLKIQFKSMRGEKLLNSDQIKKRKARDYSDPKFLKLRLTFNLLKSTSEQERQSKRRIDDRCVIPKFEIVHNFLHLPTNEFFYKLGSIFWNKPLAGERPTINNDIIWIIKT